MSVNIKTSTGLKKINSVITVKQNLISPKSVNFYDYDGELVNSYTAQEFAQLSALPTNPTHYGLTAQGWNWSLSDAKAYVAKYGALNIGQTYITNDGKTRLYISLHEGRLNPQLGLGINGSVDVDWGDGSAHDTMTGSNVNMTVYKEHKYVQEGDYVITLTVTGNANIKGASGQENYSNLLTTRLSTNDNIVYLNTLKKIELGNNIGIDRYAFLHCQSLTSINIPNTVTDIEFGAFYNCYSLKFIVIPNSVISINNCIFISCYSLKSIAIPNSIPNMGVQFFKDCCSLSSVTIPSSVTSVGTELFKGCRSLTLVTIPDSITSIADNMFDGCLSLNTVTLPDSITSIGAYAFQSCNSLTSVIIPDNVTNIGNYAFSHCFALKSVNIPNKVTRIGNYAFTYCYSLTSIAIPNSVTNMGDHVFEWCYALKSVNIPNNITRTSEYMLANCSSLTSITIPDNITYIGNSTFVGCAALPSVIIPSSVTGMSFYAFATCYGLGYVKFNGTTPPTFMSNTWTSLSSTCYILVPYDCFDEYFNTTDRPSPNSYLYLCYATYADGDTLPTEDSDGYTLTWYASREDARAKTNPITVGNGKEIYARGVKA